MKVAFLTDGKSPIPATKGGAVENLIEDLLVENEVYHKMDFTVMTLFEKSAYLKSKEYKYTKFNFIKNSIWIEFIDKVVYILAKHVFKRKNLISYRYIFQRLFVIGHYSKYLMKEDFDKVVLVTNSTLFLVLKNKKVANKYRNKVVFYLHNEVRSLFGCDKEVASICKLVGISNFVNNAFLKIVPSLDRSKCCVLKNCIDTSNFLSVDQNKIDATRKKFGLTNFDFVVLFAGRLVKEKGALEVLRAVKMCASDNIKLLIVGSGFYASDIVDEYSSQLITEAKSLGENIIFTGYIDYTDMPFIYHLGSVAVLPSMWEEPAGMTMVEAVISGIPLITTDSGGIPEYIPKDCAIILKRDDNLVENIKAEIMKIKEHPNLYKKMEQNGQLLSNEYNLDNFYKNFVSIILEKG